MGEQFGQPPLRSPLVLESGAYRIVSPEWQPWFDLLVRAVRGIRKTETWNPGTTNANSTSSTPVAVPGAALGDFVTVSFSLDTQLLHLYGYVSAANTVMVVLHNPTPANITLAEGTVRVYVRSGNI